MSTTLSITPSDTRVVLAPELSQEFEGVRKLYRHIKMHLTAGSSLMILMGLELKRLKKNLGETRGRKNPNTSGISWGELVLQEVGITDDTATKYILMAEGSKKRIPILEKLEEKLLTAPLSALTPEEQEEITAAVQNLTDGKTAKEVMQELGIARKDPGENLNQDRNKGGNSTKTVETPEQQAQGYFGSVTETMFGLRSTDSTKFATLIYSLPLTRDPDKQALIGHVSLEDLIEELDHWAALAKEAQARMTKAMRASKIHDDKEREDAARKQILEDKAKEDAKELISKAESHATLAEAEAVVKAHGNTAVRIVWQNVGANNPTTPRAYILTTNEEYTAWLLLFGQDYTIGYEGVAKNFNLPTKKKGAQK